MLKIVERVYVVGAVAAVGANTTSFSHSDIELRLASPASNRRCKHLAPVGARPEGALQAQSRRKAAFVILESAEWLRLWIALPASMPMIELLQQRLTQYAIWTEPLFTERVQGLSGLHG